MYIRNYRQCARVQTNLCLIISDAMKTEATLGVIKESEIISCLGN
uniref:40S ribosomal protein S4 n=1 Tax=Rhizophora mucronata TaxID=61149 RepID=A0A2P2LEE9_RHIMU